jgi:WD40 repeat protein
MLRSIIRPSPPLLVLVHDTSNKGTFRFSLILTLVLCEALLLFGAMCTSERISAQELDLAPGNKPGSALNAHAGGVICIALSRDGSALATYGSDKVLRVRNVLGGREHHMPEVGVMSLAFSPDSKMLAIGKIVSKGSELVGRVKLWDVESGKERRSIDVGHGRAPAPTLLIPSYLLLQVGFQPDGKSVVVGLGNCLDDKGNLTSGLWLLNLATGEQRRTLLDGSQGRVDLSADGLSAVAMSDDFYEPGATIVRFGTSKLYDVMMGKELTSFTMGMERRALVSVAGRTIVASVVDDGEIQFWNVTTGERQRRIRAHEFWISDLAFSADGSSFATAACDRRTTVEFKIWDLGTKKEKARFRAEGNSYILALSGNGKVLAAGDRVEAGTVRLWHLQEPAPLPEPEK